MSEFKQFKVVIQKQFNEMAKGQLFIVDVDKDTLWETYLASFPEGTNPMFRERTEHDCNSCKQFIRAAGNVVSIVDNKLVSVWDIEIDTFHQEVANAMSKLVKSKAIKNVFRSTESKAGVDKTHELKDGKTRTWEHFYAEIPKVFVLHGEAIGPFLGDCRATKDVFKRSMEEITLESAEIVLELIQQNSLYRGEEHKGLVELFIKQKKAYNKVKPKEKDNYCWVTSITLGMAARFRNTVIGTLLEEISFGDDLDKAVRSFESKVAPSNYKRPTALITKGMIDLAQKTVIELGIENSLSRRHATIDDITINNVLFANRDVKKSKNVFDELKASTSDNVKNLDKVEEVDIDTFIKNIMPKASGIELLVENRHSGNFMTLIAPVHPDSPNILKWDNNFSWSYKGEVADSMKEKVKAAGGKVDGVLRFSIEWSGDKIDNSDLDAHCQEPTGHIYYSDKRATSGGNLDIDITQPFTQAKSKDTSAVENITWPNIKTMKDGVYKFYVNQFRAQNSKGFKAEIEFNGQIFFYEYNKPVISNVQVAEVIFKNGEFGIKHFLPESYSSKEVWNVSTQKFIPVTMIMNSPNHWDGNEIGNKHYFFILEGCKIPNTARGFYNEFLSNELTVHRKVFEVLGSKMKVEPSDEEITGVGFSTTQKNSIICKVTGSFSRMIKITF